MSTTNGTTSAEEQIGVVNVSPLRVTSVEIPIRGITPLIVHKWDPKARQMMLDAQQGKAKPKKPAKNPEAEYNAARYLLDGESDGFPAVGFKSAIVSAARLFDKSVTMTLLKTLIYVEGRPGIDPNDLLVPIIGERSMREDTVRVGMGTADLRYRPQYKNWSAVLRIQYPESQINFESVVALVEAGGFGGVGEWRPSSPKGLTGIYGRFVIDN